MTQYESVRTPQDYVNYTFNISSKGATQVAGELAGLSSTVSTILGDIAFKTSEFLSHTETMAIGAGTAISAVFVKATQDAIRFEQQVANVKAIGGESVNAALIGDKAMEYSNKFGMAVSEMTEGLEALARAGITTTSVMTQVLEEGVKLSKLEGIDLEDSINHLISTTNLLSQDKVDMNAPEYGQMLKDMNQHIVSTSESAPINAENIMQTLQHVGGYASASGMDQDDLFAVIAQLGARGTKGEMAGTALRAFIAAGNKDTAQRALARVGLNVSDLWDESGETMLSISEMKNVLDSALEARGYSKQEKLEFYSDFVGYKQANQIMKIDTAEVEKYKDNIANAWDLGTKLNTILGTVKGNLDRIWQISQNFMTKVGGKMLPVLNAMLVPLRVGLELFTKIPFMDTLGAGLGFFVGIRTILLVINNIVPAIGGLFSSMNNGKKYSKGIRGEWEKTRDAIKDAHEVLSNWNNKDKLAQIHRKRRGPSAEDKAKMEDTIFEAMYYESSYYQELKIPWEDVTPALKHAIGREFLGTPEFEKNWERMVNENEAIASKIGEEAKVLNFGEYDPEGELFTINRYVQYIYRAIKGANSPKSKLDQNREQHVSGGSTRQETSRQPYSGESESPKVEVVINGRNTSQSAFQFEDINKLKSSIDVSEYGDYEHIYRNDVQQLIKDYNQAINDLIRKVNSFSNTKKEHMDKVQMRRYEKSLRREAMSEEGIRFASRANDSDIRYYLRTGVYRKPKDKMLGIRDDQIKAMAEKVGLDFSDIDNITGPDKREEQLAKIRQELKKKNISIDDVAEEANKVWVESQQAKRKVTYVPTQLLRDNKDMTLQLAGMFTQPTNDINQAVRQVQSFFANETDEATIASATRVMMGHLKLHGQTFSKIEEEEIKYILENIVRLENTASALNIGLEDSMRVFSETANYNHINKQLTNFWNNSGIVDDLVDNMIDAVVGQFTIVQELVVESYKNWIKSSTPGGADNIDISAIESRLRNKLFYTQQGQISTSDINEAILLKELYNEPDMYNILLRRNFTESNRVIRTRGSAPDLRYTELTNPSTGEKYRYNKEYGILDKQRMSQIFQTRRVDRSSFVIDEDLNEIYDDVVRQWKQKTVYSLSDISGENGYLHPLLGPLHESFDNYSVDELLHMGMYRKNGIGFSLTNPKEVQEAILTGLISERQVNTWIKKGLLMPSDYIDDTLSWKASGYDGQYFNKEKHREQIRKQSDEKFAANQLERERLDKISDVTSEAFDYAREKGQKSIALKTLVQQISGILDKEKDLKYSNDDIYNAIKEYADYRSHAVDIKDNKAILNKTKGVKRVRSAKDILYRDWFDENLEISLAAHQMLGIPLDAKPTDVLKDILAGNIENVDENTKLFRTKFNAGTGSRKYSADTAYSIHNKFFESDYAAARFFGLPLLVEEYQDELPIIKDLLEEGKRFEAYIELMRNVDNINYDDLDYEITHDSKLTDSEMESLQLELIDIRREAKEVADGIEFELEHLGTIEFFTDTKTPEQLEEERLHKEQMMREAYAAKGMTLLSGLDVQSIVNAINERGGLGKRMDIFVNDIGDHWGNARDIVDFMDKIDESAFELIWSISTERFENIMDYINSGDISRLDEHVAHMLHLDNNQPINWWKDWDEYKGQIVSLTPKDIEALNLADILPPEFINPKYVGDNWKKYLYSQADVLTTNSLTDEDITTVLQGLVDTEWGDKVAIQMPLEEFLGNIFSVERITENLKPFEIMKNAIPGKQNLIANLIKEVQERFNSNFKEFGYDEDDILKRVNINDLLFSKKMYTSSFDNRVKVTGEEMYDLAKASFYYNGGLNGKIEKTIDKFFTPIDAEKIKGKSLTDISFSDKELAHSELYYISKEDYEALKNVKSSYTLEKYGDAPTTYVPGYMPSKYIHDARYIYDKDLGRAVHADEYIKKQIEQGKPADYLAPEGVSIPELQGIVDLHNSNNKNGIGYGLGTDKDNFQAFTGRIFQIMGDDLVNPNITNARKILRDKYGTAGYWSEQVNNNENRIHNYGIYYDPKEWGRIVNLLDTDAVKEAFMQGYITERQLKKWEKIYYTPHVTDDGYTFEKGFGHETYGDLGYTMKMVEAWKKEKEATQEKLNEVQNTVKETVEEVTVQTLPVLSLMSANTEKIVENTSKTAEEISKDPNQSSLDDFINQQNNQSKFDEDNHYNLRQLYNSIVFTRGQRGIIQKLIAKGDNAGITKEIKKSNKNIDDDEAEAIARNLIEEPETLKFIKGNEQSVVDKKATLMHQAIKEGNFDHALTLYDMYKKDIDVGKYNWLRNWSVLFRAFNTDELGIVKNDIIDIPLEEITNDYFDNINELIKIWEKKLGVKGSTKTSSQPSNTQSEMLSLLNFDKTKFKDRKIKDIDDWLDRYFDKPGNFANKDDETFWIQTWGSGSFSGPYNEILRGRSDLLDMSVKDYVAYAKKYNVDNKLSYGDGDFLGIDFANVIENQNITMKEVIERMINITRNGVGIQRATMLYRSGRLDTNEDGIGTLTGFTSTAYDKKLAADYDSEDNYMITMHAPKGIKGVNNTLEGEFTLTPDTKYIELSRDDENQTAEILLLTDEMIKTLANNALIQSEVQKTNNDNTEEIKNITEDNKNIQEDIANNVGKISEQIANLNETLFGSDESTKSTVEGKDTTANEENRTNIIEQLELARKWMEQGFLDIALQRIHDIQKEGAIPEEFNDLKEFYAQMIGTAFIITEDGKVAIAGQPPNANEENRTDRQIIDNEPIIIDIEEDDYWGDKKQRSDAFWAEQERIEQEGVYEHAAQMAANMFNQFEEEYSKTQAAKAFANMFNTFDEDYEKNREKYQNRVKRKAKAQKIAYNVGQYLETASNIIKEKVSATNQWLDKNFLPQYESNYDVWGKTADSIEHAIEPLEVFNRGLHRLSNMFPILTPLIYGLDKALGVARFTVSALRNAEILLMAIRIASGKATEDLAEKEGYETAKKWAKKMKEYIPEDSDLFKLGERLGEYGTRALNGIEKFAGQAIGFIAENIAILGPIAVAIAVAVGALWLSEQNYAKALKKATEEYEEAHKEASASYITYKNLHEARKNEHDAMKRQQLARKESIALYRLEADRIKQLNAIEEKQKLKNDGLWGEYGVRANFQKMGWLESIFAGGIPFVGTIAKWMSGDFESQYENYEGSTGEIRRIKETALGNWGATSNQRAVSAWYDTHTRQLAQIEAFAPELQELYDLESRLIEKYGSKEAARESKEFKKAVQEFADATGLNKETAEKYLDYLQTEANVEHARYAMQAEVDMIVSNAQAEAYKALYGDEAGIGELDSVQDAMVYATADQIFKDAYQELWWSMLMEWLAAIWNQLTLNFGEAQKHAKAAGAYQDGMRELAENQGRITQEGVDIAKEDQRKDYGNDSYTSSYGDTPFGGAVASSAAQEQDYAEEEMNRQDMYYNASKSNGEAATQGFKDGLNQHSPGDISRSVGDEMEWALQAMSGDLGFEQAMTQQAQNMEKGFSIDGIYGKNSTIDFLIDTVMRQIDMRSGGESPVSNGFYRDKMLTEDDDWIGGSVFESTGRRGQSIFSGFKKMFNKAKNVKLDNSKTEIHIHTVNINTDDDPEKIKTALMELIIEFGDLVTPRQVSRIIGTPPTTSTSSTEETTTEDENAENTENTEDSNTTTNNNNTPTT